MQEKRTCSIDGCDRPSRKRNWCTFHYDRWRSNGDPLVVQKRHFKTDAERLTQYDVDTATGCWVWNGLRHRQGYGYTTVIGKPTLAHRAAWEAANGPIPYGLLVCHACDNPPCIYVGHLFLGTQLDNVRDAWEKGRGVSNFAVTDMCKKGHPWTSDTTYVTPSSGKRRCLTCMRAAAAASRQVLKAQSRQGVK